ncbi:hypothetical protein V492_01586 [Pseudogymnoascus sp. VKM F-4246]|nr:hypothetical protein V492_01586 [Pseudogymnoascus sp. VKM F-4246]
MHVRAALAILSYSALVAAWFPGEHKAVISADDVDLFNRTAVDANGKRYLPGAKIRGVNLGSLFVVEPWMMHNTWANMGCGDGVASEFDCVLKLGQDAANSAFKGHWDTWITQADLQLMVDSGINTIRIPVGYWMKEDLVYADSEHFPQGGLTYLTRLCGWASDMGLYIIMDLHAAPGAQQPHNAFTGQDAPVAGFYVDYQFERALKFVEWMANLIHTDNNYRNVGMLELVNEPIQNSGQVGTMRSTYYPDSFSRIRAAEAKLNIGQNDLLHIQMMNEKWGSGQPTEFLTDNWFAAYDDHRYLKWASIGDVSHDNYIRTSCNDDRGGNTPTIVGEWSMSVPDDVQWNAEWDPNQQPDFYKKWFAAQVISYEKQQGWTFWSWKTELGDLRWDYQAALKAGVIPKDLDSLYNIGAC